MTPRIGLGITAGLDAGLTHDLAARCAQLGYHSLWSNYEPAVPRFQALERFHAAAPELELGVGVLPLDRNPPEAVAADLERLAIDPAKLWIGIGSGALRPQLAAIEQGVAELRRLLPSQTRIVVAAMRPRLARLGGAIADGVLLNWMPPAQAAQAREWVRAGAAEAGRPAPLVASYVRVAVGDGAQRRLREEEGVYREVNDGHRRHFAALETPLGSVGVAAASGTEVRAALRPYGVALDLPIVRVLSRPDAGALRAVAEAAAPLSA